VLGCDAAGIVQHVGPGVAGFEEGDRVFYQCNFLDDSTTSFQQYATIPADLVAKIPTSISFDQASTLGITGSTAAMGMYHTREGNLGAGLLAPWREGGRGKYARQPFLVMGGSASVGQYAIQFARLSGFSPVITTASLSHDTYLKELGATHVFDRKLSTADLRAKIEAALGGPLNYAYDAIGHSDTTAVALDVLASGGTLASVADRSRRVGDKTIVSVYGTLHAPQNRAFGVELFAALGGFLADGSIKPNRVEILPNGLRGVPDGLERLRKNLVSGVKLVARPQETD